MENCVSFSARGLNRSHIRLFLFIWHRGFFCGNWMERALDYVLRLVQRLMIKMELYLHTCVNKHTQNWVKRDQLDSTCCIISLFNAQHVSDVTTSILRSLRRMCWVISWVVLIWFDACCWSLHTDTTPPQPNHNVTPTRIEPDQYNPWSNSARTSQAPEDGCINIRNMLSIK